MKTGQLTTTILAAAALVASFAGISPPAHAQPPATDPGTATRSEAPREAGLPEAPPPPPQPPVDQTPQPPGDPAPETSKAPPPSAPIPGLTIDLEPGADLQTGIRGRIIDRTTGAALANAPVTIVGQDRRSRTVTTDAQGAYVAHVPPGTYTVRSRYDFFHGARLERVRVTRSRFDQVNLVLDPINLDEEVVVQEIEIPYRADTTTAAAQDQIRKESSGIGEGFGAKQMSQVGASDASSAAARVVGVSIESAQLVIRGLGGRYNRVLLNGVPVPSMDPDVPGVDLDLFPTSVIDSLNISKTFLPDMPADFAGGVMEIKSVSFPREFNLELGISAGLSSQSTFRDRLNYRGGAYDNLGFDDGSRSIPRGAANRQKAGFLSEQDAEAFRNSWQYDRKPALPKLDVDLTVGDSIKLGTARRFGYLLTAGYERDSVRKAGLSRPNNNLDAEGNILGNNPTNDYRNETGTDVVALSTFGTANLDLGTDHSLSVLSLFNRNVEDETSLRIGRSVDGSTEKWQLQYLARTLWFNQVFGDHRNLFGTRLRLRWAGFHSYGERDEPDRRTVAYLLTGNEYEWIDTTASGTRFFSNLRQDDLGGNLALRFPLWAQAWGTVGGATSVAGREFSSRRFRMRKHPNNRDGLAFRRPVEELFSADGIGKFTELQDATRDDDSYQSRQLQYAGFLMVETPLVGQLSLAGGVRAEILTQLVESRNPFANTAVADAKRTDRTDVDFLPGVALKYQLSERMLLRAAYGMTVARPQIRELAPYSYYDFLRERSIVGDPDLKRTLIHNADLRWEWFFDEGQILAVSAFYKNFADPIELAILDPITGSSQFKNGTSARNLGTEIEIRTNAGRLARSLRFFNVDANLSLVDSRIELPRELTAVRSNRRLAGQSPYVANVSLRFYEPSAGVTAALVYNVVGPRIVDVATRRDENVLPPDIEEMAFHSLDLVGSVAMGKHLKLKLKIKNLLMERRDLYAGASLINRSEQGITASLGLSIAY